MLTADGGIVFLPWNSWQVLTVDSMYVKLLVIAVLGFIFSVKLDEIGRRLIPWKSSA
jgi:NitT/TauT family transport system permease protein